MKWLDVVAAWFGAHGRWTDDAVVAAVDWRVPLSGREIQNQVSIGFWRRRLLLRRLEDRGVLVSFWRERGPRKGQHMREKVYALQQTATP